MRTPSVTEAGDDGGLHLLDTHVWIWAFHGEHDRFSEEGVRRIAHAAGERRTRISAISVLEVGRLVAYNRIAIGISVDEWIARATAAFGEDVIAIDRRIALESTRLPGLAHKDPADRLLVATAVAIDARLVTVDDILLDYGALGYLRVLDPRG